MHLLQIKKFQLNTFRVLYYYVPTIFTRFSILSNTYINQRKLNTCKPNGSEAISNNTKPIENAEGMWSTVDARVVLLIRINIHCSDSFHLGRYPVNKQ